MLTHKLMKFIQCQTDKLKFKTACWQDGFVEGGLDNTHTVFTHTNQVFVTTFDDGTTGTFNVASATDWTDQVSKMATGLGSIMPWAQTVTPFCNIPGGCGGLPEPLLKLNQMVWRYVGFRICHGGKVPVSVSYTSDQQVDPKELILQYKTSAIIYLDRCFLCGVSEKFYLRGTSEEYVPVCPTPCGTTYPPTPLVSCTNYPPIAACDNLGTSGQGDDVPIVVLYKDCGNGLEVDYMFDDGDALIPYDLVGDPVDCISGEIIPAPTQPCADFHYERMYTMSTPSDGLLNVREWHDTEPTVPLGTGNVAIGAQYRTDHDFSLTPDTSTTQSTLVLNDANNAASEMDVQVVDGYIIVENDITMRYNSASEGYVAVELGKCGGPLELLTEDAGFPYQSKPFVLPKGVHQLRLWNLDLGGSNSSLTAQYTLDGITWVNDNTPPGVTYTSKAPSEECVLVKICKPSGDMFDHLTGAALTKADYYPCPKMCVASGDCGCSGIKVVP